MSIEFARRADRDIEGAEDDIVRASGVPSAVRFQAELAKLLARLESMPLSSAAVDPPYRKHPGMRSALVGGGFQRVVFYQPVPGGIRVVRVLHGRMDFDAVFG